MTDAIAIEAGTGETVQLARSEGRERGRVSASPYFIQQRPFPKFKPTQKAEGDVVISSIGK